MSELFGGDNLIEFDIHYKVETAKSGATHVKIISDEDTAKAKSDLAAKDSVKTLHTRWLQQTWQSANELLRRSTVFNFQTNKQDIDYLLYRDARLKTCLVEWNAKDKDGQDVPCNENAINRLHANIALALLDKYDQLTTVDSEEKTKN